MSKCERMPLSVLLSVRIGPRSALHRLQGRKVVAPAFRSVRELIIHGIRDAWGRDRRQRSPVVHSEMQN